MNDIVKPLTPDGMVGWDKHGQLWLWKANDRGHEGRIIGDPRGHLCKICRQGWILTAESLEDQERWDTYKEWTHLSCSIRYAGLKERDMWCAGLDEARLRFERLEEIPNGYWRGDPWAARPWYRVNLLDAPGRTLRLGRRKRVYHMEIESRTGGPLDKALAETLFKDEDVTKAFEDEQLVIHAWTGEKAHEYLKAFSKILDSTTH